jgi:hypothetical protein
MATAIGTVTLPFLVMPGTAVVATAGARETPTQLLAPVAGRAAAADITVTTAIVVVVTASSVTPVGVIIDALRAIPHCALVVHNAPAP